MDSGGSLKETTFKKREKKLIMERTPMDALIMNLHDFVILITAYMHRFRQE